MEVTDPLKKGYFWRRSRWRGFGRMDRSNKRMGVKDNLQQGLVTERAGWVRRMQPSDKQ